MVLLPKTSSAPPERARRALSSPGVSSAGREQRGRRGVPVHLPEGRSQGCSQGRFGGAPGGFVCLGLCQGHAGLCQAADPFPRGHGGHPKIRVPLCSHSQRDEIWGGFLGLILVSSNPPSCLLTPPTLTPKLTRAGPDPHQPPALFPRLDRADSREIASLPGNTGCCEDGRQQPLHPGAARNREAFPEPELGPAPPRRIQEEFRGCKAAAGNLAGDLGSRNEPLQAGCLGFSTAEQPQKPLALLSSGSQTSQK